MPRPMTFPTVGRSLLVPLAVIAAIAMPVAPAFGGEEEGEDGGGGGGGGAPSAHASRGCVNADPDDHVKVAVTGNDIVRVAFYVDGDLVKTDRSASPGGRYVLKMRCAQLSIGATGGRAVATLEGGERQTVRFQIIRSAQDTAQFTG
jgi:hypothetical protein